MRYMCVSTCCRLNKIALSKLRRMAETTSLGLRDFQRIPRHASALPLTEVSLFVYLFACSLFPAYASPWVSYIYSHVDISWCSSSYAYYSPSCISEICMSAYTSCDCNMNILSTFLQYSEVLFAGGCYIFPGI